MGLPRLFLSIFVRNKKVGKRGFFPYRADEGLHDVIWEDIPGNKNAPKKKLAEKISKCTRASIV